MKGCARGMHSDALQVGLEGRVGITGNASAGAMAGFPRVRLSPLTAVGAWPNKGVVQSESSGGLIDGAIWGIGEM